MACHGKAAVGEAGTGKAWIGAADEVLVWVDWVRRGRLGHARPGGRGAADVARTGKSRRRKSGHGLTSRGASWRGMVRRGRLGAGGLCLVRWFLAD
jgi:hypothetical protein